MTQLRRFYVYIHRRVSDGLVFYVGKGTGFRSGQKSVKSRSEFWGRVSRKHGRTVHILFDGLTNSEAIDIESSMIKHFSDCGCPLVNIKQTDKEKETIGAKMVYCSNGMVFDSVSDAAFWVSTEFGFQVSQGNISTCARGERNSAYGLAWSYTEIPTKCKIRGGAVYCSNGMKFQDRKSAVEWLVKTGILNAFGSAISVSCTSDHKTAYGYKWSRTGVPKMPDIHGQAYAKKLVIERCAKRCRNSRGDEFESAASAARHMRQNGFSTAGTQSISAACTGRQPTAYGLKWEYF